MGRRTRASPASSTLDYGYLDGTVSGDGIDIWRGTLPSPTVTAIVCAIDLAKRDMEMKLLLGCTAAEIAQIAVIHNGGDQAALVVTRQGEGPTPNPSPFF